jgi:hypothetical protein
MLGSAVPRAQWLEGLPPAVVEGSDGLFQGIAALVVELVADDVGIGMGIDPGYLGDQEVGQAAEP